MFIIFLLHCWFYNDNDNDHDDIDRVGDDDDDVDDNDDGCGGGGGSGGVVYVAKNLLISVICVSYRL